MRIKRILLIALCVLALIVAGGFLFVRYYLQSPHVTHQVAERLEAMYGGHVKVGTVDVGVGGSALHGFALFEEGTDAAHGTPWLTVGAIETDISLWDLIRGQALPRHVTLKQVKVSLRFDADGHLITRFPPQHGGKVDLGRLKDVPDVVLEDGEVVLRKRGHPALVAREVSAKLTRDAGGKIVLSGTGDSDTLGKLHLGGSMEPQLSEAAVTLKPDGVVHVTQSVLASVPFVPAVTWRELQVAEADSTAELAVHYSFREGQLGWRLTLAPTKATARIPVLDLAAHGAAGSIVVNDYRIDLRNLRGKAYGGDVQLDGDLDFSTADYKLSFPKIKLTNLDIAKVPDSWNPAELDTLRRLAPNGKLTGTASVVVTMPPGKVKPGVVDSFIGLTAAACGTVTWLPAVTALAAFPGREIVTESSGKATITGIAGGSAEIELKLGPPVTPTQPAATPMQSSQSRGLLGAPAARAKGEPAPSFGVPLARGAGAPSIVPSIVPRVVIARPVVFQPAAGPEAYPAINAKVARTMGMLVGGVNSLMRDMVGLGGALVGALPKKLAPPAPVTPETPTMYLDLNLKLKDVDLALLVKGLGIKVNGPVAGKMSVQVTVSMPTNRASNLKEYKLKGAAQAHNVRYDGISVANLDAGFDYAGGVLNLTALKGRFAAPKKDQRAEAGTFAGSSTLQVVPLGALSADLTLNEVPIDAIAGALLSTERLGGTLSGQLSLRGPADKLKDPSALAGSGKVTVNHLSAYGLALDQVTTGVQLKGGVLRLIDLHSTFAGTPITASGELRLDGNYPFKATANLKNWDLAALAKIAAKGQQPPIKVAGSFSATADVQGTLNPLTLSASGEAAAAALGVDKLQVSRVRCHWSTDGKALGLTKLDAELYGGQATGSAMLPLHATAGGAVNLTLRKLDGKQLVKELKLPVKIDGAIGGVLKGTLAPTAPGMTRTGTFDLDVTAPKLRVQNIPTEQLHGKLDYKNGSIDYKLEGKTLGGTFELDGQVPASEPVKKESKKGKLRIENIALVRLSEALGLETAPVSGRLSVELDYTWPAFNQMPEGTGKLRLVSLRWQDTALAASLAGDLVLSKGLLQLRQLTGELAQGVARIAVSLDLHRADNSRFTLDLEGVEAGQLLAPWTGDKIKGTMQARIRGRLGATWRGHADVELTRGEVYGMQVADWRLPAEWHYAPATGRAQVEVYETTAQLAHGRMLGKLSATREYTWRIDGNARFFAVDLQTLIRPFVSSANIAAGRVTGQFSFSGMDVQSVNDLTGNLVASFSQAQVLQIPGLSAITSYIGTGATTTFQRGSVHARLDRGVVRIQSLALEGGVLKVHADGTVSLAGGLNLNVVAKTGDVGLPTLRLGVLGLRIPIYGPVPIVILQEVSNLLANQVIYVQVTGTIHSPIVRLRPVAMLSEEAVRFFLNRANLPIPLAP